MGLTYSFPGLALNCYPPYHSLLSSWVYRLALPWLPCLVIFVNKVLWNTIMLTYLHIAYVLPPYSVRDYVCPIENKIFTIWLIKKKFADPFF
jgi:hypothetical protein